MKCLAHHVIIHRLICPHTHHQKGVIERKQRQIVELGITMLHHASLPLEFWDYAFVTIVYLINRLPTTSLKFSIHILSCFIKHLILTFSNLLDVPTFLCYVHISLKSLTLDMKSVYFLVTLNYKKAINVYLSMGVFLFPRM